MQLNTNGDVSGSWAVGDTKSTSVCTNAATGELDFVLEIGLWKFSDCVATGEVTGPGSDVTGPGDVADRGDVTGPDDVMSPCDVTSPDGVMDPGSSLTFTTINDGENSIGDAGSLPDE